MADEVPYTAPRFPVPAILVQWEEVGSKPLFTATVDGLVKASGGVAGTFLNHANAYTVPAGGSALGGTGTLTLPTARFEHEETIAATGVTGASRVLVWLRAGTDADENTADMLDLVTIAGTPGTDTIAVIAAFSAPTSGPILLNWSA